MKSLIVVLGTLIALEMTYLFTGINVFFNEWLKTKPIRLDIQHKMYRYIEASEIEALYQIMHTLCDLLNIKRPKTYLVGNIGAYARDSYDGYIIYTKQPKIVIYYNEKMIYTMAHELYHAWQRQNCPERFDGNMILNEWVEQSELEAQAFAIAYIESNTFLKLKPEDWKHRDFSMKVKNNLNENGEIAVLRVMADAFKEKYFKGSNLASHSCTKCS